MIGSISNKFSTSKPSRSGDTCQIWTLLLIFVLASGSVSGQDPQTLWSSARKGDLPGVKKAIESGVDVNAKTDYGATALSFSVDRGHLEIVKFLIENKADPNVKDSFYGATPMDWANGNYEIMKALVTGGAQKVGPVFAKAISEKDTKFVESLTKNPNISYRLVKTNLDYAKNVEFDEAVKILEPVLKKLLPKFPMTEALAKKYAGKYHNAQTNMMEIAKRDLFLSARLTRGLRFELDLQESGKFKGEGVEIEFVEKDGEVTGLNWTYSGQSRFLKRLSKAEADAIAKQAAPAEKSESSGESAFAISSDKSRAEDLSISSRHWPQFRGNGARGIADGQSPPLKWNVKEKENVAWSIEIPGLGHSCPCVWGKFVFLTTAVSEKDTSIKTGLYGDVASVDDDSEHEFVTYCINKNSGKVVWKKTAIKCVPKVKRHLKSTHANSTVATDGKYVVSWFGSEGVYCYSMEGKLLWKKDLGLLDSGWFYDREYQWQFGASPIIHDEKLILLCDIQDQSFIASYDLKDGKELWKTDRDEIPSWSTPTVVNTPLGKVIVTNATKAARGYEFDSGKEIWRIEKNSEIAVPTPFAARNLIFVSSGYRPVQPIYAIRLDAMGDLTLEKSTKKSEYVAWSETRGGPYMPSPIVYGDYLYTCSNSGILTCYQASTGKQVYKERLRMKGIRSFVGSPIAADGHLYLTSEDGETAVVRAGPKFELVANNFSGENCLTTAAISEGKFLLRTQKHLFAFETVEPKANTTPKTKKSPKTADKEIERP